MLRVRCYAPGSNPQEISPVFLLGQTGQQDSGQLAGGRDAPGAQRGDEPVAVAPGRNTRWPFLVVGWLLMISLF